MAQHITLLLWLGAIISSLPTSAQSFAFHKKSIDLGDVIIDQEYLRIGVMNQTNQAARWVPQSSDSRISVAVDPVIDSWSEGGLYVRLDPRQNGRFKASIKLIDGRQKKPIELTIRANVYAGYLDANCPDFGNKKKFAEPEGEQDLVRRAHRSPSTISLIDTRESRSLLSHPADELTPIHLILLVDASVSMKSNGKLEALKSVTTSVLNQLRPIDRASIIRFDQSARILGEGVEMSSAQSLFDAVSTMAAQGYTNGQAGIEAAFDLYQRHESSDVLARIMIISDGAFNLGADENALVNDLDVPFKACPVSVVGVKPSPGSSKSMKKLAVSMSGRYFSIKKVGQANSAISNMLIRESKNSGKTNKEMLIHNFTFAQ